MNKITVHLAGYEFRHPKGEWFDTNEFFEWLHNTRRNLSLADCEVESLYTDVGLTKPFDRFEIATQDLYLFPKLKR